MIGTLPSFSHHAQAVNLTPVRIACALLFASALGLKTVDAQQIEIIPGLTAIGGFNPAGAGAIPVSYSKDVAYFDRANGSIQCWTWLRGDAQVLQALARPGILPVRHHWERVEWTGVTTIPAQNLADEKRRRDPSWVPAFLQGLRNELMRRHTITVSTLSRPIQDLDRGTYKITILTRNGKQLAGSDGRPIYFKHQAP